MTREDHENALDDAISELAGDRQISTEDYQQILAETESNLHSLLVASIEEHGDLT